MDYAELQKYYKEIIGHIVNNKLYDVFILLEKLIKTSGNSDFDNRFQNHFVTYQNMLKYSFEYQDDPEKINVYNRLIRGLLKLTDEVKEDILFKKKTFRYYKFKEQVNRYFKVDEKESLQLVDSIAFQQEVEKILDDANIEIKPEVNNDPDLFKTRVDNIFKYVWLTDTFHQADIDFTHRILTSRKVQWYDKSVIVSALMLSLLRFFDEGKIILLIELVEKKENQIWQRAFIGLTLSLMYYNNRAFLYPEIVNRLKILQDTKDFQLNTELFFIQFIWQTESEKIAKRINEELLPDVMRMKSMIEEKLDLDNIIASKEIRGKNPDWENYFKDSPDLYKKFEEISRLQHEGADIFMGAFAYLKQIPFFNEISNWFVPFYVENDMVNEIRRDLKSNSGIDKILEGINSSYFLCNSDKYSFCYNLKQVFATQNPQMVEMLKSELEGMNEMAEDSENINAKEKNKSIFKQYLQDLYRFYALYPGKSEFENIFFLNNEIYKSGFLQNLSSKNEIIHKIGELYFNSNIYDKSLEVFKALDFDNSGMLLEKIAFCYQKMGKFDAAIEYYNKALLFEKNLNWTMHQLAFCYRKTSNYKDALKYYLELEKINPDDLLIQADIGHSYLGLEEYENAIKHYFKVEYSEPENHKVQRPIAWCSFLLGKFDVAKKYFEKIIKKEKNKNDLLNLGHVYWCMGDKNSAISGYARSFELSKNDYKWFDKVMREDSKHLMHHGINKFDIHLMVDYIKMRPGNK